MLKIIILSFMYSVIPISLYSVAQSYEYFGEIELEGDFQELNSGWFDKLYYKYNGSMINGVQDLKVMHYIISLLFFAYFFRSWKYLIAVAIIIVTIVVSILIMNFAGKKNQISKDERITITNLWDCYYYFDKLINNAKYENLFTGLAVASSIFLMPIVLLMAN